jgi:adenine-specific DNA-methyltransferase
LDSIRVPQKCPNKKHYRGSKIGELSGNPLGKSPGDVWIFPNVKWNHVEKTIHPCQFPVELVERLVLGLTRPGEAVLDPYGGVGTSVVAAVLHGRRGIMAEVVVAYAQVARERLLAMEDGSLRTRPMDRPVYDPPK